MVEEATYIRELLSKEELLSAFPIMKQLRTHLNEETYLSLIEDMKKEGYKMFALYAEDKVVALSS
ncbi:hypothetical protein JK636_03365 [Clostridium sp. YIM B02515]|uniref:Uncharacterized protein n=1 Tax=Clostridium rhizosphaerae TaxID=2803861 RepID=A0ABS1T645_9CLOT|nr:hypothetical protein [Clostridium rhizosphaerae]MBL4934795.1 hypothetical protein [Clostridium rhizosphaerae]